MMVKEEVWSVPIGRVRKFFLSLHDVSELEEDVFSFGNCRISLSALPPSGGGMWAVSRTKLCLEGEAEDVTQIYHRFFLQFLSAGG